MAIKKSYDILSSNYLREIYDNANFDISNISLEIPDILKHRYLNALKKDLSLIVDLSKACHSNRDLELVNTINELTINNNVNPVTIENLFNEYDNKYASNIFNDIDNKPNEYQSNFRKSNENIDNNLTQNSSNWMKIILLIIPILSVILIFSILSDNSDQQSVSTKKTYDKVELALENPILYWRYSFVAPRNYTYILLESNINKNTYCVLIGIKFTKDMTSFYYLDNSYDDGKITINTDDLTLNKATPVHSTISQDCQSLFDDFTITTDENVTFDNNVPLYFLYLLKEENLDSYFRIYYKTNLVESLISKLE